MTLWSSQRHLLLFKRPLSSQFWLAHCSVLTYFAEMEITKQEGGKRKKEINEEEKYEDEDEQEDDNEKKKAQSYSVSKEAGGGSTQACCQVEYCTADMGNAKSYHRRHKVCEYHAKAPDALIAGLPQRFCQQCSRFPFSNFFSEI